LLLVTHNNNLDFADWVALAGVDTNRKVDELIEVAASSIQGELKERLLLVQGLFDRERIFHAAEQNNATQTRYEGEPVLLVKPFSREQQEMTSMRWMAIIDNRTAIFGYLEPLCSSRRHWTATLLTRQQTCFSPGA
jgi:hypothetical protein